MQVEVRSVGFDVTSRAPVVVLEDRAHSVALPIWIGAEEARAIALQLEGIQPPRPLTHDLFKSTLDQVGVHLERVEIAALEQSTYYARIHFRSGGKVIAMDSRPSDAIALAMRFQRPIYVAAVLMEGDAAIPTGNIRPADSTRSSEVRGISVQGLTEELAAHFALPHTRGVIVTAIGAGAPHGLARGDIIVGVDQSAVRSVDDFRRALENLSARDGSRLHIRRGDRELEVALPPVQG
ncbi:MAG TPA: bifunctional nuclease domain-containing protein [Terriglobales bacterium]|nr:bifunctional nuclease domain-containing protein [Terriglobales bacterium]